MKTRLSVKGFIDRRNKQLLGAAAGLAQAKADEALEQRWRSNVANNPKERRRVLNAAVPIVPSILRRQAGG